MFLTKTVDRDIFDPLLVRDPVFMRTAVISDFGEWTSLRDDSRPQLIAWEQDWAPQDLTLAAFRRRLRHCSRAMRNKSGLPLLIFHRDASRLAGGVTLSNMRFGAANSATIGYWIGARFAKQGLATAAVAGLIDHAFERIGLNRIEAACQPGNAASQRVLEKCGFRREGFARDYLKINGHWRDHAIYAVTASDHRQRISEP